MRCRCRPQTGEIVEFPPCLPGFEDVSMIDMSTIVLAQVKNLRRALVRALAPKLAEDGIGTVQFAVLRELALDGPTSQIVLSRSIEQDPAATARALEALEDRGWIAREVSSSDRRQKEARLTAEGREVLARVARTHEAFAGKLDAALSNDEREQFVGLCEKLIRAVGEPGGEAA